MARKNKQPTVPTQPATDANNRQKPVKPLVELPEDEQWRLINESGVLNQLGKREAEPEVEEHISLGDEIFNAALLIIPFSSLLLLMEILIRQQYGKRTSLEVISDRMVPGVPILSIFIFYTNRYKYHRRMQMLLFVLSSLVGSRMIYILNNANWITNMKQAPPLATMWIYAIIQLKLGPAVMSLFTVASFVWWKDLKIKL